MKKILLSAILGVVTSVAFGQGAVTMNSSTAGTYAKFSNTVSQTVFLSTSVPSIQVGLYWATDQATLQSGGGTFVPGLATVNATGFLLTTTGAGARTVASRAGTATWFQLRAWTGAYANYDEAKLGNGLISVLTGAGAAPVVSATPTTTPTDTVPALQWNPGSTSSAQALFINLVPVPEPSVIALGLLGLGGLLFLRRRK